MTKKSLVAFQAELEQKTCLFFRLWAEFLFAEVDWFASSQDNPRETHPATETGKESFAQQPLHGVCH
jgi:hypothetical protein